MAVVGFKPKRRCVDDNVVATGVRGADRNVDAGKCGADVADQFFGPGPGAVMDGQCSRTGVRQRVGEGSTGAAGARHVKSPAFDLVAVLDQSADKTAAVQQGAAEAAIGLAAYRVDDLRMHAVAFESVA